MFVLPALAYACMAPFVVVCGQYKPNYDVMKLVKFRGTTESSAFNKLDDHFGASKSCKWSYVIQAKELGPAHDTAGLLQLDGSEAPRTSEEVAFAQHAVKMSRKVAGSPLRAVHAMEPEFGAEICKFAEKLQTVMNENHYKMDTTMIDSIWYGQDPFFKGVSGCRTQEQLVSGLQERG